MGLRAAQGFVSSGDGYNRRFDEIVQHIVCLLHCIDDSLLHDLDMSEHWWRAIEFLEVTANAGIVLDAEKFQFCEESVGFAGFRIILNISDIRSWFGLVNQVSHYAQLRELMEPLRNFLSPKI